MEYLNNYKLYSKINLTLHLHQLHSQHILGVSDAHAMLVWLIHGVRLAHTWSPPFISWGLNHQTSWSFLLSV